MKMKEKIILCFSFSLFFRTVCSTASIDERFQHMESVIQTLLAENQALKTRLDQLEELQDRVLVLEENCKIYDESARNGKTNIPADLAERHQEIVSADGGQAQTIDDNEEYNSQDIALKTSPKHGIVSADVTSKTGHLLKRAAGSEVAFHVYLSGNRCYSNHETFIFDTEPVDFGGGFNNKDGIFDAPATGLYVFTWTVAAPHGSWFVAELLVDGVVKGAVMTDADVSTAGSGVHPATGLVLANVNAGSHVFIRFVSGTGCSVESDSHTRTSFTGWLLL